MASVVNVLGRGGQRFAERVLGWSRGTIRKGQKELAQGEAFAERFSERGRKPVEEKVPGLLADIRDIVEPLSQTDPTFRSTRFYSPLTAKEVRRRLIKERGYALSEVPSIRTVARKLTAMGFRPQRVRKCQPLKKVPQTDAIFERLYRENAEADAAPGVLRLSADCKAVVKVGAFSRGGHSRVPTKACDHDFAPKEKLTPFGLLLPDSGESHLWFATGRVTADFMVDRLEESWPEMKRRYQPHTLLINADNGPESNGHRRQWLKRLAEFADRHGVTIKLAYYPPYHSKYNPVERLWGVLENHWRGQLLETVEKTLGLARTMTYRHRHPVVRLVRKAYKAGITLSDKAMAALETRLQRDPSLGSWFITIAPQPLACPT